MAWFLFLLLCLFQAGPAEALTLSELLTRTRIFLRDTATSASRQTFSDTQLTYFLNDSQKEVNLRTFAVVASSRIQLASGTTEYSLPSTNVIVLRVTVDNVPIPERTFSFLDDSGVNWIQTSTGPVDSYYVRTSSSLVNGVARESIGFHSSSSSGTAIIDFLAQPTDLSIAGDTPFGSDNTRLLPFHHILAYRSAYLGWASKGNLDMAAIYLREFEAMIPAMEAATKTKLSYNPNLRGNMPAQAPAQAERQ